jgi:hypothetical protein
MSQETEDSQQVVSVSNVGKKFAKGLGQTLRYGISDIGRDLLMQKEAPRFLRPGEFWALDDVSLGILRGEALATGCRGSALGALNYCYRSDSPLPQNSQRTTAPPEKAVASIVPGT